MASILSNYFNIGDKQDPTPQEILKPSVTLMEWEAPDREFEQKPREYYRKIAVIIIFFGLLLLLMKEFVVILVMGAVFFVVYVFHTIPPRTIRHKITTNGIDYGSEHLYRWSELRSFYIDKGAHHYRLIIDTVEPLPGRLLLILDDKLNKDALVKTVNEYISINESPEEGVLDKILKKISRRLNI